MELIFSEYPLNILQEEQCMTYLKKTAQVAMNRNLEDYITDSLSQVVRGLSHISTIDERFIFSIVDNEIRDSFAKYIQEQTYQVVTKNKDIISVCRETAIILYIVMTRYVHSKNTSISQACRVIGRACITLAKNFSLDSIGEAWSIEHTKLEIQASQTCQLYILALVMQILFSGKKFTSEQKQQIKKITVELQKERKVAALELPKDEELYITDNLPVLLSGEIEISISNYAWANKDKIYEFVMQSNSPAISRVKSWIEAFCKE